MIITNGKVRRTVPEQVSENMIDIQKLKNANFVRQDDVVDNLSSYQPKKPLSANQGRILKDMLNQAIAGVFHYKGSVATFADLPSSGMEIGDTYNVLDTGNNFTWDGTGWDQLSGLVDLSAYYTKTESDAKYVDLTTAQTITGIKTFSNGIITDKIDASSSELTLRTSNATKVVIGGSSIASRVSITPESGYTTLDLGSSSKAWKDLYFSGVLKLADAQLLTNNAYGQLRIADGDGNLRYAIGVSGAQDESKAFYPYGNDKSLGLANYKWKDLYLSGEINIGGQSITATGGGANLQLKGISEIITWAGDVRPFNSNNTDLGTATHLYKNLYLAGDLSDGTNTVNIADLAALITYAKAQGWIS